ncbi:Arm DNA-binding domain-containing protein [Halomonas citrativorans]|uniref:Arm DNA-binding domain-containing protein n=1 Tax=Halomonas citrativorans TaxID=2742612 RepID=UPI001CE4A062
MSCSTLYPANLKKAAQHRAAILSAIDSDKFDYQVTFTSQQKCPQVYATGPPRQLPAHLACRQTAHDQSQHP